MDVATITMPADQAREKLAEYRAGLQRRSDEEYERAAATYEQLAKGRPILMLTDVFVRCPRDERGRPRLAIARADRTQVRYSRWMHNRDGEEFDTSSPQRRGRVGRDHVIRVMSRHPVVSDAERWCDSFALVPMVPPDVARGHDLSRRFILWEVEQWADRRIGVQPDRDPYLLLRVAPDVYAVVGEWDLTDVERAVMAGIRGGRQ